MFKLSSGVIGLVAVVVCVGWCSGGEWHAEPSDFGCAEAWDLCETPDAGTEAATDKSL
jgi:hypothetical protein